MVAIAGVGFGAAAFQIWLSGAKGFPEDMKDGLWYTSQTDFMIQKPEKEDIVEES